MKFRFMLENGKRRPLTNALGEALGAETHYLGAPTFCFEVGGCLLDKDGVLDIPEEYAIIEVLGKLAEAGFRAEGLAPVQEEAWQETMQEQEPEEEPLRTAILLPADGYGDTAMANLRKLVEAKEELIRLSLRVDSLAVTMEDDVLRFDWFDRQLTPEELAAYTQFLSALCRTAKEQSRVSAKVVPLSNPKYEFRTFLLKLGFIGSEFKAARELLLAPLPGNSAFKNGRP